jgi:hypothetical protein
MSVRPKFATTYEDISRGESIRDTFCGQKIFPHAAIGNHIHPLPIQIHQGFEVDLGSGQEIMAANTSGDRPL